MEGRRSSESESEQYTLELHLEGINHKFEGINHKIPTTLEASSTLEKSHFEGLQAAT